MTSTGMRRQVWGIRLRLWLAAALPALLVVGMLLFGFLERHDRELTTALSERAQTASAQLGGAAEFALFASDEYALQRLAVAALAGDPQLQGVAIFSRGDIPHQIAGRLSEPLPNLSPEVLVRIDDRSLLVLKPVYQTMVPLAEEWFDYSDAQLPPMPPQGRHMLGHVVMEFRLDALQQQKHDALVWALAVTFVALVFAAVVASIIASSVTRPLHRISGVVQRIASGDLTARAHAQESGVMEPLALGINAMAAQVALSQAELHEQVRLATEELRKQKEAAERAARTDPLTGLYSRRATCDAAEVEIQRALRYGTPLSLIMIDLDYFKSINDTYGHALGDAVLVNFSHVITQELREVDVVGRLGGEEFVVLLPYTDVTEAVRVAERMRLAVASSSEIEALSNTLHYTASFGVAGFDAQQPNFTQWLDQADQALYQAKRLGRNRVELAPARPQPA